MTKVVGPLVARLVPRAVRARRAPAISGHDSDPDRERAHRPEPVLEHALLEERRRQVPACTSGGRSQPRGRRRRRRGAPRRRPSPRPTRSRATRRTRSLRQAGRAGRAPRTGNRTASCVRTRTPRQAGRRTRARATSASASIAARAISRKRERRSRDTPAARRRGTASTRARAPPPRRPRRRARTAARRRGGRGQYAGKIAAVISSDAEELDQRRRRCGRRSATRRARPGTRRARRSCRLAGRSEGRPAGVGDRARDLRELDLVAEQRRRLAPPCLPRVERAEHEHTRRRAATANQGATGSRPASARARSLGRDLDERRVADLGRGCARAGTARPPRRTPRRRR